MTQQRCPRGQQLWAAYARLDSKNILNALKRAAALVDWQDHQRTCRECADGKAAAYEAGEQAPVIPFDLEEAR